MDQKGVQPVESVPHIIWVSCSGFTKHGKDSLTSLTDPVALHEPVVKVHVVADRALLNILDCLHCLENC